MAKDNDQDTDDTFDADFENDSPAYDENFSEDENFEEEDWDSFDEQDEADSSAPAAPKKKSKMSNVIIVAIAVVGGLGFMVIQAGKGTQTATPPSSPMVVADAPSRQPAQAPATKKAEAGAEEPPATEQGFLNSPKSMETLESDMADSFDAIEAQTPTASETQEGYENQPQEVADNAAPPMPPAINSPSGFEAAVPSASAPAETPAAPDLPAIVPAPAPADSAAVVPRVPQANDLMKERPVAPAREVASAQTNEFENTASAPADGALNEKIDQILNRLDQMESDINSLRQSGAPQGGSSEVEKIASLEATIEKMESRIEKLQKTPKASATAATPQILGTAASSPPPRPARAVSSEARPASREAVSWVLKGAQPGQAMVARSGSSEMQTVVVGDTLPGVGKITGVVYRDGRWVVEGTSGRIQQ